MPWEIPWKMSLYFKAEAEIHSLSADSEEKRYRLVWMIRRMWRRSGTDVRAKKLNQNKNPKAG